MRFDTQRKPLSRTAKQAVIEAGGGICAYCGDPATIAEHVTPYVFCQNNNPENLVPSCATCNRIAGSKTFANFNEKRDYILRKRETPKWRRRLGHEHLICCGCRGWFIPHTYGATAFLCGRCSQREGYPVYIT